MALSCLKGTLLSSLSLAPRDCPGLQPEGCAHWEGGGRVLIATESPSIKSQSGRKLLCL